MSCGSGTVKIFLFIANCVFAFAGLSLIVIGSLTINNVNKYDDAIPDAYDVLRHTPILTIVLGSIIFIISFLGCCGAYSSNYCMLNSYAFILLVILLLQVALGIYTFIQVKDKDDFKQKINSAFKNLYIEADSGNENAKKIINLIESEFDCKGYSTTLSEIGSLLGITKKCDEMFYDWLNNSANVIGIVLLSLVATEIIGTVFALCLVSTLRSEIRRQQYA
ncbi:23 kDa integral membrane protein-like [Aethina tumida]|uniref:23 kDa integral membrane protein-like n=1 Tax=Aethina tumida TaxID=116153 RepID=UPI0021476666|nr:23 kDa integral membrane protein-like [Aethina tumida]